MSADTTERLLQLHALLATIPGVDAESLEPDLLAEILWLARLRGLHLGAPALQERPAGEQSLRLSGPAGPDAPPANPGETGRGEKPGAQGSNTARHSLFGAMPPPTPQARTTPGNNEPGLAAQIQGPAPRPLPDRLELGRALKPLRRRVLSHIKVGLDEAATVASFAESGLCFPVLRPQPERWLDLVLLIDQSASLQVWRDTVEELRLLFHSLGAFRDIRCYGLCTDRTEPWLRPYIDLAGRGDSTLTAEQLTDPGGRRLFLFLSDYVADGWYGRDITDLLERLCNHGQVALIQLLPERLWPRTALGLRPNVLLRPPAPGMPGRQWTREPLGLDEADRRGVAVPVAVVAPKELRRIARLLSGSYDGAPRGVVFADTGDLLAADERTVPADLDERLHVFEAEASPRAIQLARMLAVLPVTLPVARLAACRCSPPAGMAEIAELLLSGLLTIEQPSSDPNRVRYVFAERAQLYLARHFSAEARRDLQFAVGREMAELLRLPFLPDDFEMFVQLLSQADVANSFSQTFALLTARTLELIGGEKALDQARGLRRRFEPQPIDGDEANRDGGGGNQDDRRTLQKLLEEELPEAPESPARPDTPPEAGGKERSGPGVRTEPPQPRLPRRVMQTRTRLSDGVTAARARLAQVRARFVSLAGELEALGDNLPQRYSAELDQAPERHGYAATALEEAAGRLDGLETRITQVNDNVLARLGFYFGVRETRDLELVDTLIAEAATHLDNVVAALARVRALPLIAVRTAHALIALLDTQRKARAALAQASVSGPQLDQERRIALEAERVVEALPEVLTGSGAEQQVFSLTPVWIAAAIEAAENTVAQVRASLERLRGWHKQIDAVDTQIAELERRAAVAGKKRAELQQIRGAEVLGFDFVQLDAQVDSLLGSRRQVDVAGLAALASELESAFALLHTLEEQLVWAEGNLKTFPAILAERHKGLAAIDDAMARETSGPYPVAWDSSAVRREELAKTLQRLSAPTQMREAMQTDAETQEAQQLGVALNQLAQRVGAVKTLRKTLIEQRASSLLERDDQWAESWTKLANSLQIYGSVNWRRESALHRLLPDARRLVERIAQLPAPGVALEESELERRQTTLDRLIHDLERFDSRVAGIEGQLRSLNDMADDARSRVDHAYTNLDRIVAARAADATIKGLHRTAGTLQRELKPRIDGQLAELVNRAKIVERQSVEKCIAYADDLGVKYAGVVSTIGNQLSFVKARSSFWRDNTLVGLILNHERVTRRMPTPRQCATIEQAVEQILHYNRLLVEVGQIASAVQNFYNRVKQCWSKFEAAARDARLWPDFLRTQAALWPPVEVSPTSVEGQLRQAESLVAGLADSDNLAHFERKVRRATAAFERCNSNGRRLQAGMYAQRSMLELYERQIGNWLAAVDQCLNRHGVVAPLRDFALARCSYVRNELTMLRFNYDNRISSLTPAGVQTILLRLHQEIQEPIPPPGSGLTKQWLVTTIARDGTVTVTLGDGTSSPGTFRR